jgi:hypothetical protein
MTNLIGFVEDYVASMKQVSDNLGIQVRDVVDGPFDWVSLAHISKVFAIADSCLVLLKQQHPDEAFGLARTIVECAANLRYLTQDPAEQAPRTHSFAIYAEKEQRYWLEQIRAHVEDSAIVRDAERFAESNEVEKPPHKPLAALAHWSGLSNFVWRVTEMNHPLDGDTFPLSLRKKLYAGDYHSTSHYVHCSEWGLRNYYPTGPVYAVRSSSEEYDKTRVKLLALIAVHLHENIRYALFGLGITPPLSVDDLFTRVMARFADDLED